MQEKKKKRGKHLSLLSIPLCLLYSVRLRIWNVGGQPGVPVVRFHA